MEDRSANILLILCRLFYLFTFTFPFRSGIDGPLPTSRQAWREVRDHTEREADTRRAYCEALQDSVVRILQEMASVQGRIKGRIREDLERATNVSTM